LIISLSKVFTVQNGMDHQKVKGNANGTYASTEVLNSCKVYK